MCALLGPNGSGKTTILKALCGFHNPTKGEIFISGTDKGEQINECIGYVPEISILPPDMKVGDFLLYTASIHKKQLLDDKSEAKIEDRLNYIIKKCELSKVLNKKIKTLSKGYKQRVSFAQAIIHDPENLILDEPISGLDPAQIVQMRALIKELSKDKAVLISTHILQEVTSLCDRVFIINNGKLVASGTEKEIIQQQKTSDFEQAFIKLTTENI